MVVLEATWDAPHSYHFFMLGIVMGWGLPIMAWGVHASQQEHAHACTGLLSENPMLLVALGKLTRQASTDTKSAYWQ